MLSKTLTIFACFIAYSIQAQIPSNDLMFWMPYNGNPNDSSVNKLKVLHDVNTSYVTDRFGNENSAVYFDGNAFIQMKDSTYLDYSLDRTFSAGLWIKADQTQPTYTQNAIFSIDSDCDDFRYSFQLINTTNILYANDGSAIDGNSGCWNFYETPNSFSEWVHIAVVANDKEYKMYKNGDLIKTRTLGSVSYSFYPSKMMIGAWRSRNSTSTTSYFKGAVDDLFTFDRALTDQEILDIYNFQPSTTSNNDLAKGSINIFPNPTNATVSLKFSNNTGYITIINLLGEQVYSTKLNSTSLNLNVESWTKGLYLVTYTSGSETVTSKLIVK